MLFSNIGPSGIASAQTVDEVREWLAAELAATPELPPGTRLALERLSYTPGATREAADALRAKIGNRVDHPEKERLAAMEQELRDGPPVAHFTLWYADDRTWRHESDASVLGTSKRSVSASGQSGDSAWRLGGLEQLRVNEVGSEVSGSPSAAELMSTRNNILNLIQGGVNFPNPDDASIEEVRIGDSGRWSARLSIGVASFRLTGRWDADLDRGFIESRTAEPREGMPDYADFRVEFEQWDWIEPLAMWSARSMNWYDTRGDLGKTYRLAEVSAVSESEVRRLARVPDPTGTDPIYGRLELTRYIDERPGHEVRIEIDPDSGERMVDHPALRKNRLKKWGWVVGIGVVAAVAGLAVWKRSSRGAP